MGRAPCCDKANVKKGPWSPEEDEKLKEYIEKNGIGGNWIALPQKAGLKRCGKSCRLRWLNYLRPNLKHGEFSEDEDRIICTLFASIGSRWSIIASQLPGRTDNDIKNYWNTKLKKKMIGLNPSSVVKQPQQESNNFEYHPYLSFTGSESNSYSSTHLSGNSYTNAYSTFQAQESSVSPIQNFQVNSVTMLGGEVSCSSSDEVGYGGNGTFGGQIGALTYPSCGMEDTQKLMLSNVGRDSGWTVEENRLWGENPLNYCLEEIKQLVSTTSMFDDNKTGEMVMYY